MKGLINTKYKGAISVYLCLVIAVLIPILLTMFEAARFSAMKLQVECATDMGMDSCLAEYHRELLNEYGLLFVDSAYDTGSGSLENVQEHISYYMNENLRPTDEGALSLGKDLFDLSLDSVNITGVSRATDEGGEVFRHMAISYMLEYYGIAYVDKLYDIYSETKASGLLEIDINEKVDSASSAFSGISVSEEEMEEYDLDEEPDFDNPSEGLDVVRSQGILSLVCDTPVSGKTITPANYVSGRSLSVGDGVYGKWPEYNQAAEEILFNEYIMKMCGNYLEPKSESMLDHQVEYIIFGRDNDTDNLKETALMLLGIRGGANTIYFFSSGELQSEAAALATTISAVFPPAQPIILALIEAVWIFAESIYDVRQLMHGGKVSLFTTSDEWNLGLENAIYSTGSAICGGVDTSSQKGWGYEDYLRLMLYLSDSSLKTIRCMDIVEMDIRKITDDPGFMLDNCIAAFEMQAIIYSSLGYEFLVKKDFAFW